MEVIGNFCLNLTILISSCDHGQCDSFYSLVCHCCGEFLLLLGKDLEFLSRPYSSQVELIWSRPTKYHKTLHVEAEIRTATWGKV